MKIDMLERLNYVTDTNPNDFIKFSPFNILVYHFGWDLEQQQQRKKACNESKRRRLSQTDLVLWFDLIVIYLLHCQTVGMSSNTTHGTHGTFFER